MTPQHLAHAEARNRASRHTGPRIRWSVAMGEAPPHDGLIRTAADELAYRRAYAAELVRLGVALPASAGGGTTLVGRLYRDTPDELQRQTEMAEANGMTWNEWARERLRG